jgi:predicted flap endonuclease-1-like 5' DNA nuclease
MKRYSLDPDRIGLARFMELTRGKRMLPGRVELQQQMDARFEVLRNAGISSLGGLLRRLGSASKMKVFSAESGLAEDYLVLLKREAGSYLSRPFPLSAFPGIPYEYTEALKSKGYANTRDFFEKVQTLDQTTRVSGETGIPLARLKELHALCDLSRITGVGGVLARVMYESGIRSAGEFAASSAPVQFLKFNQVIDTYAYAAGHVSEEDVQYCMAYASLLAQADLHTEEGP